MELRGEHFDRSGNRIGETYSTLLSDPFLEKKLKAFDPSLKLTFDQVKKKWVVLEWAPDNSGWNIIVTCEDKQGKPKAPGEWILNKLFVYRERYREKERLGLDKWFQSLKAQADYNLKVEEEKISQDNQARLRDDVMTWKKGARELDNLPASDVTAGYRKI